MEPSEWRVIGRSVQGSTHLRDQKPNQDAIRWYPDKGCGLPLIVAVADGHGSAKYFRSHFGAQLATGTAVDVLREFAEHLPEDEELMMVIDRLPAAIERRWKQAVDDHLIENPFDEDSEETPAPVGQDSNSVRGVWHNALVRVGDERLCRLFAAWRWRYSRGFSGWRCRACYPARPKPNCQSNDFALFAARTNAFSEASSTDRRPSASTGYFK